MIVPLSGLIDTIFLGNISQQWVNALGVVSTIQYSLYLVFTFLLIAATSQISYYLGNGDIHSVVLRIKQTFLCSALMSFLLFMSLYFGKDYFYNFMQIDYDLSQVVDRYYNVRLIGLSFSILTLGFMGITRGLGHRYLALFSGLITTIANIIFSYYGLYIKGMDLQAAAYGTIFGEILGFICIFICFNYYWGNKLWKKIVFIPIKLADWKIYSTQSFSIFLRNFMSVMVSIITGTVSSRLGSYYMGVLQIIMQLLLMINFFMDGLAIVGNMEFAKMLGENKIHSIFLMKNKLLKLGFIISLIFVIFIYFSHHHIFSFVTIDLSIQNLLSNIILLILLHILIQSQTDILDGIVYGLGLFHLSAKNMMINTFFVFIPCVYFAYISQNFTFILLSRTAFSLGRMIVNHVGIYLFFHKLSKQSFISSNSRALI